MPRALEAPPFPQAFGPQWRDLVAMRRGTRRMDPDKPGLQRRGTERQGPRPLGLHLALAGLTWASSPGALALLKNASPPWKLPLAGPASDLAASLAEADSQAFVQALNGECLRRQTALIEGIQAYRKHPYRRDLVDPPTVWQEGSTRLLDYGSEQAKAKGPSEKGAGGARAAGGARRSKGRGLPILVVPSLINRAYVLDLTAERSFLRWLTAEGFRPYLVDWGRPGPEEQRFTLTDYIAGHLAEALSAILDREARPPVVLGYCMGGLLALGLAQLRGRDLAGLACLATPWDFHAEQAAVAALASHTMAPLWPLVDSLGELPVDLIQGLFTTLDPQLVIRKFTAFSRLPADDPRTLAFVALEDWLNDGVPLAGPVAQECVKGWYGDNSTVKGRWRVAGRPVLPAKVNLPSLCVIPARDRIVPSGSATALAEALPGATVQRPAAGHIGMMVSKGAEAKVWTPLAAWLWEAGREAEP